VSEETKAVDLIKYSPSDQAIAEMASQYMGLSIRDIQDTAGYKAVHDARMVVKGKRVDIEKKRKELKRVALDYGKAVDSEAARLTMLVEEVENPAKAKLAAIDNIIEEQRKAEQLRRHNLITANEWQVMGSFYVCGVHNIMMEELHTCTPERLNEIVAIGQAEKTRKEAEAKRKLEEEAAAKAEQARVAAENAQLAAEAEELRKKLAALEAANAPKPKQEPFNEGTPLASMATAPTPRMFESHPRPQGFEVPPVGNAGTGPLPPIEETPFDKPRVGTVTAFDYGKGFDDCRNQVIALLNDPTPRKRSEFIELITNFKPAK
jgi:hypothetical protein